MLVPEDHHPFSVLSGTSNDAGGGGGGDDCRGTMSRCYRWFVCCSLMSFVLTL